MKRIGIFCIILLGLITIQTAQAMTVKDSLGFLFCFFYGLYRLDRAFFSGKIKEDGGSRRARVAHGRNWGVVKAQAHIGIYYHHRTT